MVLVRKVLAGSHCGKDEAEGPTKRQQRGERLEPDGARRDETLVEIATHPSFLEEGAPLPMVPPGSRCSSAHRSSLHPGLRPPAAVFIIQTTQFTQQHHRCSRPDLLTHLLQPSTSPIAHLLTSFARSDSHNQHGQSPFLPGAARCPHKATPRQRSRVEGGLRSVGLRPYEFNVLTISSPTGRLPYRRAGF